MHKRHSIQMAMPLLALVVACQPTPGDSPQKAEIGSDALGDGEVNPTTSVDRLPQSRSRLDGCQNEEDPLVFAEIEGFANDVELVAGAQPNPTLRVTNLSGQAGKVTLAATLISESEVAEHYNVASIDVAPFAKAHDDLNLHNLHLPFIEDQNFSGRVTFYARFVSDDTGTLKVSPPEDLFFHSNGADVILYTAARRDQVYQGGAISPSARSARQLSSRATFAIVTPTTPETTQVDEE